MRLFAVFRSSVKAANAARSKEQVGAMVSQHHAEDGVYVDPAMVQSLGVRTALVEPHRITAAIRTTGYVDYDENRLSKVNARVSGWVDKVYVAYVGQRVGKGQALLSVYSPELVLTQEDYLRSRRLAAGTGGAAGAAQTDGHNLMDAAVERLRLFGIARSQIKQIEREGHASETLPLLATTSGVVTATSAVEGAHVKAGDDLYTLADLSRVWIYADIYEPEVPLARVGQRAAIVSDALPGKIFEGRVDYIYPDVNEQTRTVKLRLQLDNPREELKPGMYVKVTLLADEVQAMLAIPDEAVLISGIRHLAIIALGDGHFEPRQIEVGAEFSGYYPVLAGLMRGERVVTSAQFLIDSESNLNEALQAMALSRSDPALTPKVEK
jgi:RND family efflux transporter MFP subunit